MKKLIISLYTSTLFLLLAFSYFFLDHNLPSLKFFYTGFSTNYRSITSGVYIFLLGILFIFYFIFVSMFKKGKMNFKDLLVVLFITSLVLLFSYPAMLSADIFNYIATAKITYFYHENPYLIMPIEMKGDSLLLFMHAANKVALYGPAWILLSAFPHFLGFGNFIATLISFKIFTLLFYIGTVFFIWKLTKNVFLVSIFSLNPLVVIESLVSSHNDIVMMFFVMGFMFFVKKNMKILATVFLIISILIKYATIFLIPIFLYIILRNKDNLNWKKIYFFSLGLMLIIFFLSPIREEMYPWYAIWFLSFSSILSENSLVFFMFSVFSFSLLLRYLPYMLLGTYSGQTPVLKIVLTVFPLVVCLVFVIVKKKIWLKNIFT